MPVIWKQTVQIRLCYLFPYGPAHQLYSALEGCCIINKYMHKIGIKTIYSISKHIVMHFATTELLDFFFN